MIEDFCWELLAEKLVLRTTKSKKRKKKQTRMSLRLKGLEFLVLIFASSALMEKRVFYSALPRERKGKERKMRRKLMELFLVFFKAMFGRKRNKEVELRGTEELMFRNVQDKQWRVVSLGEYLLTIK